MKEISPSVALSAVANVVRTGAVVLVPTDTVYGLAARPDSPEAVRRIFAMKGRPPVKNLPVMLADPSDCLTLGVDITAPARRLLDSHLVPGAVTLALGFSRELNRPQWLEGRVEVAVRIPDHDLLRALIRLTGPLLVTSANRSGSRSRESVVDICADLLALPDYFIDGGRLDGTPSALVNCRLVPPVIERQGALADSTLEEVFSGDA